jgi:antiviral helicase SKI2
MCEEGEDVQHTSPPLLWLQPTPSIPNNSHPQQQPPQEKSDVEPELPPRLAGASRALTDLARELGDLQVAAGLPLSVDDYLREVLHPGLMQVVYEWARGTPFAAITALTDVMEGSIVRAVVRLDQCCRELMDAARVMGDTELFTLMQDASARIRRDIVFAASLYVA